MEQKYWSMFWSTGLPEAWLMSRRTMPEASVLPRMGAPGPAGGPGDIPEGLTWLPGQGSERERF